jgi:hypothetical protein
MGRVARIVSDEGAQPASGTDPLRVTVGAFALESLSTLGRGMVSRKIDAAIRYYLDAPPEQPGRPYPAIDGAEEKAAAGTEVDLTIDSRVWTEFADEAARQGVGEGQLVTHAILFYVAAADARTRRA